MMAQAGDPKTPRGSGVKFRYAGNDIAGAKGPGSALLFAIRKVLIVFAWGKLQSPAT
jgi:hypothetical protein